MMHKAFAPTGTSFWQSASVVRLDSHQFRRGLNTISVHGSPGYYSLTVSVDDPGVPPLSIDLPAVSPDQFSRTIQLSAAVKEATLAVQPPSVAAPRAIRVEGRDWAATSRLAIKGVRRHARRPRLLFAKAMQVLGMGSNLAFSPHHSRSEAFDYATWCQVFESAAEHDRLLDAVKAKKGDDQPLQIALVGAAFSSAPDVRRQRQRLGSFYTISDSINGSDLAIIVDRGVTLHATAIDAIVAAFIFEPSAMAVYGDHDTVGGEGERSDPVFKPNWSPTYHIETGYAAPLVAIRLTTELTSCVQAIASHDEPATALLDHFAELQPPPNIFHVPAILSHRTMSSQLRSRRRQPTTSSIAQRSRPTVTAIIPTKDNPEQLQRACRSVLSATGVDADVVLVDNGAGSASQQAVLDDLTSHCRVTIEPYLRPFNFSAMINAGRRRSKGETLLLLNDDVESLDDAWLAVLVDAASRPGVGAVGALLLYPDRRIQHAGIILDLQGATHAFRFETLDIPDFGYRLAVPHEVSAVTAACLTVRTDVFDMVGGLAEELPVTLNDIDFCLKVLRTGRRNLIVPNVRLVHNESVSRGLDARPDQTMRLNQETIRFLDSWRWIMGADPYSSLHMSPALGNYSPRDVIGPSNRH